MPSISLTLYISKLSTFPMLAEAGLLLYAVCIVQAQVAKMEVQFKRQYADGSLDIAVTCSSTILTKYYFRKVGPCNILSTSRPRRVLASLGSWGPLLERAPDDIGRCEHQLRLVDTQMYRVMANQFVSGKGGSSRNAVMLPTVSSKEQLFCERGFEYCTEWTKVWKECKKIEIIWASSLVHPSSNIRKEYVRAAKINIESSITGETEGEALDIPYNGNVTLECEVQNMKELSEDRCRWQFMNNQNTLHSYGGGQDKHVDAAASFPRTKAVVRKHTQRPNVCLLELTGVDETMEGRWSCNPSEGSADGFISPSTPVLIKVVDGCKSHSDCPENHQLCLNATDEVPRRICGNPCNLEEGKKICGNLENALCKVEKKAAVGMVCACQDGFGSDTGYPDNRTRCLPLCPNKNQDCIAVEGVCIAVKQNTPGRCFPVCEVTMPECGLGASCQKIRPIDTNAPWTSKCECEGGKFKNDLLPNTSFECELPIFNGLHMNIKIDGREQPETCSISHANESKKCQTSVTDGSLLQVTCEAPRVFPAATLELGLKKYIGEDLPAVEAVDDDSLLHGPPPGQPLLNNTIENLPDQLGAGYRGHLPAINVTIADHDNATFVCKLTTPGSSNVTVIEIKLNVTRLPVAPVTDNLLGSSVSTVAGSAAASVIAVIVLGAIVIIAIKHRQRQHQQKQGSNSNDSMALSQISNTRPSRSLPPPSSDSVTVNATTKGTHRSNITQQPQNSHHTILSGQPTNTSPKPSTARPVPSSRVIAEAHLQPASIGKTDPIPQVAEIQEDLIYADLDLIYRSDAAAAKPLHNKTHNQLKQNVCEEETIYAAIVGEIVQDNLQPGED